VSLTWRHRLVPSTNAFAQETELRLQTAAAAMSFKPPTSDVRETCAAAGFCHSQPRANTGLACAHPAGDLGESTAADPGSRGLYPGMLISALFGGRMMRQQTAAAESPGPSLPI